MPRIVFENLGRYGVIRDRPAHTLPLEAWNDARNVRFFEDSVRRLSGHSVVWTPTVDPWWLLPVQTTTNTFWLYANDKDVYVVDQGGTHTEISRTVGGDYAAVFQTGWNGGILNGIPVVNNGVDVPQMWSPPTAGTPLVAVSNWDANYRAKVIRPLRNFLVALDIVKSGTRYPHNVLWSHSALPGAVPSSWDTTDATKDAGEVPVAETAGFVIDMLPMRDVGVLYKEDSTWLMQYVGGNKVFSFTRLRRFGGIFSRHCVKAFDHRGEKHFVVSRDDIIVHDGQNSISVADKRMRRWLFGQIDATNYQRLHVYHNPRRNELAICVPDSTGQSSLASLWNYVDDKWSTRELPALNFAELGLVNPTGVSEAWDSDSQVWDADDTVWDERNIGPITERVLFGVPGASRKLFLSDDTPQFNGVDFDAYVERVGLAVVGQDREGNPKYDLASYKLCTEIWPRVEADAGTPIRIFVASQDEPNKPVTWTGPFVFIVGTDLKVNPMVGGKLLGVRFEFNSAFATRLYGFDMDIVITGAY